MEISDKTRVDQPTIQIQQLQLDSDPQQSEIKSSQLGMAVVLNETNSYWSKDAPLRCASNAELPVGGKVRRDFKFQVIQVRSGPKWFIWNRGAEQEDENELGQSSTHNNGSSDQENQHDSSGVRRSMRFMNRRKVSNEFNKHTKNNFTSFEDKRRETTATNQSQVASVSESAALRINTKAMCQSSPTMECRFQVNQASLSVSPPSTSSECSNFSNQSTFSCISQSDTFKILSVAKKWESDDEDDDTTERALSSTDSTKKQSVKNPAILISELK